MVRPCLSPGIRRCLSLPLPCGLLAAGLFALAAAPARASSPSAWAALGQQVLQACRAASSLRNPQAAGERVDLPAANGAPTSVLLLQGTYPQPHMAGRRGLELCLYDGGSRRARVVEADRLVGGARRP